ncbi:MAG: hypothetical protein GY913_02860 [Proteobacteria bacterium]|nr:hypothetical protein [Pseudomonadota bacterium]MCP4915839.1 hypothetical protein [Pseudomonadota bacterium]
MLDQHSKLPLIVLLAGPLLIAGCDKDGEDTGDPYCPPVAFAGPDQSVALGSTAELDALQVVELDDGTSEGPSGYPADCAQDKFELAYVWEFQSAPVDSTIDEAGLTDNNSSTASASSFIPDVAGTYVLSLVVSDDLETSTASVVVIDVAPGDAAPIADAGPDHNAEVDERVTLDGSASSDPEGAELEFNWALSSSPECSLLESDDIFNQGTETPSFICDCEGIFVISLAVSDGSQWSDPDYANVTCSAGDQPPIADAGDSSNNAPCDGDTIELNGYGSWDPEGEVLVYAWSVVSVPADSAATDADFDDASQPDPSFTWDVEGEYTFQLQVFDGTDWSAPDVVTMVTQGLDANQAPVANAGAADSVSTTTDCERLSYSSWDCEDCPSYGFDLDASASWDPDGDELRFEWNEATGETTIESPYTAATEVETPPVAGEYNTATTYDWNFNVTVADCNDSDDDEVTISVTCTGEGA